MKVEQDRVFKPVRIELEHQEEFAAMVKLCAHVGDNRDAFGRDVADLCMDLEHLLMKAAGL